MARVDETTATNGRRRFGREDDGHPVSADEFASAFSNEPWTYERINGRLLVLAPADGDHVETIEPWRDQLALFRLRRPDVVRQVVSQPWVRVDADNDRIGEIGVYLVGEGDRRKIPRRVPELMFEFVGRSAVNPYHNDGVDHVVRRRQYAMIGVCEYVVVDRFDQAVMISTLGADGDIERALGPGETYESPLLPGFAFPLDEAWPA